MNAIALMPVCIYYIAIAQAHLSATTFRKKMWGLENETIDLMVTLLNSQPILYTMLQHKNLHLFPNPSSLLGTQIEFGYFNLKSMSMSMSNTDICKIGKLYTCLILKTILVNLRGTFSEQK